LRLTEIGIDIEETSKFRNIPYESNTLFYKKIFSINEIQYCLSKPDPYPHFTVRFCAKEAVIKALNNEFLKLSDIEIIHKQNKPILKLPFIVKNSISLSHTKDHAIACVIILN